MAYIRKRGNNYLITVSDGRDQNYRTIQKTMTFRPDPSWSETKIQRELKKAAADFESKVKSGNLYEGSKMFFSDFTQKWFGEYVKVNLALNTQLKYEDTLRNHLLPAMGNQRLVKLTTYYLQTFLNGYYEEPMQYSHATVQKIFNILRSIFKKAYQWQVIEENPMSRVELPSVSHNTATVKNFTSEQARAFLQYLDIVYEQPLGEHPLENLRLQYKVLFTVILYGGLRKGEALALTWSDIDFACGQIHITKSIVQNKGQITIKPPKTAGSVRTISMPVSVMDLLKRYKDLQDSQKKLLSEFWNSNSEWLFTQHDGSVMNYHTPYHTFKKIIQKYNADHPDPSEQLPDIPLHGLRHTTATLMIANHADPVSVSARLGHSQTSTTLNTYAHAIKSADQAVGIMLDDILRSS